MSKLRYSVTYEIDQDFLCDQKTLDEEFEGSWENFMVWFYGEEPAEVINGLDSEPLGIKLEATDLPDEPQTEAKASPNDVKE